MNSFITSICIILYSVNAIGQIDTYLQELNTTSIILNKCKIREEFDELCIELASKEYANQPHNHLLFSRLATKYYQENNINKAYKYAVQSEKSLNFNNIDFSVVFEIYENLGHNNYIKNQLLPKYNIVDENDKLAYGYYLSKIESEMMAYTYLETNYDFNKDPYILFKYAKPYLDLLWIHKPAKAELLCERLLREKQQHFSIETDKNHDHYNIQDDEYIRKSIHITYIIKALAHSRQDEFEEALKCLKKANEYREYRYSEYVTNICVFFVIPYSKKMESSTDYIKSLLPKSLGSNLDTCNH